MRQRSEEWFEARSGRITGSRFRAAMARRSTLAYRGLVDQLVLERATGALERSRRNAAMQWGIDHEDDARKWYARSRHVAVREVGFVVHPDLHFVGVSPDGLVATDGLIEIKCPQLRGFDQVMSSGRVPTQYRWQIQGQLWVCQREWTDFVCFYPPGNGRIIRVHPENADFDALAERCSEIHSQVERCLRARIARTRSQPMEKGARSRRVNRRRSVPRGGSGPQ